MGSPGVKGGLSPTVEEELGITGMSGLSTGNKYSGLVESCLTGDSNVAGCELTVGSASPMDDDMVVEEGILNTKKDLDLGEVLVLSEISPFWLLLLGGSSFLDVNCSCPRGKLNWLVRDSSLAKANLSFLGEDEIHLWPSSGLSNERRTFLIEGSRNFGITMLSRITRSFRAGKDMLVIALSSKLILHKQDDRRKSLGNMLGLMKWRKFRHSDLGGVSSDHAFLGYIGRDPESVWPASAPPSAVMRFVSGLQRVDVGGVGCLPPSSSSESTTARDPGVHCPPSGLLGLFKLRSVFAVPTGWVERRLTIKEVAAAWDVPPDRVKRLESDVALGHTSLRDLLRTPPLKSLQAGFSLLSGVAPARRVSRDSTVPHGPFKLSTFIPDTVLREVRASHVKAVKNDDAVTETGMWDTACVAQFDPSIHSAALKYLRQFSVKLFVRNVKSSFARYLLAKYNYEWVDGGGTLAPVTNAELRKDLAAGFDGIRRAMASSFWVWDDGSTPFFWRWQPEVQHDMRDGTKLYIDYSKLPKFTKRQRLPKDPILVKRISDKIQKVRSKGYITAGSVSSLTGFFHVPKGDDDIRIVYDLTACGLNDALWAPNFWMPTIVNVLDCATEDSWFGDVDAGEMFLNYMLDENIRPYAGVDVSWLTDKFPQTLTWEHWCRMAMGMRPSPFVTIRLFAWAMEIIKGDRKNESNPFYWSDVILNCPGALAYDPGMPRVYKRNDLLDCIAADCVTFVDDLRTIGTRELVQRATHRVETLMGYLGLQDATRKRRAISQNPGEWTGSKSVSIPGVGLFVTVSLKKWDKAKRIINDLLDSYDKEDPKSSPEMNLKGLEQKVGFLVHLSMAYPLMVPYLRGFYLTMNSWRKGRDEEGWKSPAFSFAKTMGNLSRNEDYLETELLEPELNGAPSSVYPVPVLREHLSALSSLFRKPEPTLRLIRGASVYEVCYVFGDASGEGFGSSWTSKEGSIAFRYGIWGKEGQGTSSNYRELRNLVETMERLGEVGELVGREVFLFTDNAVAESIAARGSSSSPKLFELVVRLNRLEMEYLCKVNLVHVAGTRMIDQGTDGLSRGDMYEGVMAGESMLLHVPLHLSAIERNPLLVEWIKSWSEGGANPDLEVLACEDWFERGHDVKGSRTNIDGYWIPDYKSGLFLWSPPPGAARVAIEQLRQARLKRQSSTHIFVVPRLMVTEWRRQVIKAADIRFEIPVGHSLWGNSMHEPLTIAICFPYISRQPWELRKTELMVDVERKLQGMLQENPAAGRHLLSQLFNLTGEMDSMPLRRLRRVLQGDWGYEVPHKPSIQ
jgi:hypothetical protein